MTRALSPLETLKLERLRKLRHLHQLRQQRQQEAGRVARSQARKLAEPYLYDPAGWARDCIDWSDGGGLTGYQEDILAALVEHGRVAARGPHGLGKSSAAAITVLWFATTRDAIGVDWKILTTASAWRQLTVFLWPEVHKWARRVRWETLGRRPFTEGRELLDLHIKLTHGAAAAVASNDPAKIEGGHADSLLFIFDEAKAIPANTWDAAEGAFSGGRSGGFPEAFALALSTPGAPAGRFYEICSRKPGYEDWYTIHVTLDDAIAAGRISHQWAEQRRRQWGEQSALYHNRVLGEFYAGDEDSVIPLAWVEAAVERWHQHHNSGQAYTTGPNVVGVDVARSGGDETVFALRRGVVVAALVVEGRQDTMQTTARVQAVLAEHPGMVPAVDSIGVGAGVVDRLRELGVPVVAYTGSAGTTARDRSGEWGFKNVRSAAYWNLRELLDPANDPQVCLPPDDLLLSDLTAPTWRTTSGLPPRIVVEPKEDVVARLGRSPDRGDAVVMAFWADRMGGGPARVHSPTRATGRGSATAARYATRLGGGAGRS